MIRNTFVASALLLCIYGMAETSSFGQRRARLRRTAPTDIFSSWIKVSPEGGGFSALFPSAPTYNLQDTRGGTLRGSIIHRFQFHQASPDAYYEISYGDLATSENPDTALGRTMVGMFGQKRLGVDVKEISLDGSPGREYNVSLTPNVHMFGRIYIVKRRLYVIQVIIGDKETSPSKPILYFLNSFKLNDV